MMNKRGFTLLVYSVNTQKGIKGKKGQSNLISRVPDMFITVIVIAFLVILGGVVWYSFSGDSEVSQAEGGVENILVQMELVEDGVDKEVTILNPEGWEIGFFKGEVPRECFGENCVCICDSSGKVGKAGKIAACNAIDGGFCKDSPKEIGEEFFKSIDDVTELKLNEEKDFIFVEYLG